jgi:hypothetical protein
MTLKVRSLLAALAVTGSLVTGTLASPAAAAAGATTCTTVQRTTYSPGVTLFPSQQGIQVTSIYAPCVSTSRPDITSGTATVTFQGSRSCLTLDSTGGGTAGIRWNTGETSTYTYVSSSQTVAGQIVLTIFGTVTAGVFQGSTITILLASPVVNVLACLFPPGITSRIGVGTLTISQ